MKLTIDFKNGLPYISIYVVQKHNKHIYGQYISEIFSNAEYKILTEISYQEWFALP